MTRQSNLFGEPAQRAQSSQWWTPPWLASKVAEWIPDWWRVLEPSCGNGNLIAALLANGHDPELIAGNELDPNWADFARKRFDDKVSITCGDFFTRVEPKDAFDCVLMNPPYENGLHSLFLEHALTIAPVVIGIFPHSIEYGVDRDRMWREKAFVMRRARCAGRVSFGGAASASFETIALRVQRRGVSRTEFGEVVTEFVWT